MGDGTGPIERISAVTLVTADMERSCAFYSALGFDLRYGGDGAAFTSYRVGSGFLNLQLDDAEPRGSAGWGRVILWVEDVDAMHDRAVAGGYRPETVPADAPWGERYFHVRDPDGHEVSIARLLR